MAISKVNSNGRLLPVMGSSDYYITNLDRKRVHLFLDNVRLRDRHLINKGRGAQLYIESSHTI